MRRQRYRSPAKKKRKKNLLIIVSILIVALLGVGLRFAMPSITKGVSDFFISFKFPWQKKSDDIAAVASPAIAQRPGPSIELQEGMTGEEYAGTDFQSSTSGFIPNALASSILPEINLDLTVNNAGENLGVIQMLSYTNESEGEIDQLKLYLPNSSLIENTSALFDRIVLDSMSVLGTQTIEGDILTIHTPQKIASGQKINLTLSYTVKLPNESGFPGYGDGVFRLSDYYFYPINQNASGAMQNPTQRQLFDFEVNCTYTGAAGIASSGVEKNKSNLSDGGIRMLYSAPASRTFATLSYPNDYKSETISAGSTSILNVAKETPTVLRISELSGAIIPFYENRYGVLISKLSVVQSNVGTDMFFADSLIAYSEALFADAAEFRYQYALSLARQYFPSNSGIDEQSDVLNMLLCHEIASAYIISSQGDGQATFAYEHAPAAKDLAELRTSMDENTFDLAVQQYLTVGKASYFDSQTLLSALPYEIANRLSVLLNDYIDLLNLSNPES